MVVRLVLSDKLGRDIYRYRFVAVEGVGAQSGQRLRADRERYKPVAPVESVIGNALHGVQLDRSNVRTTCKCVFHKRGFLRDDNTCKRSGDIVIITAHLLDRSRRIACRIAENIPEHLGIAGRCCAVRSDKRQDDTMQRIAPHKRGNADTCNTVPDAKCIRVFAVDHKKRGTIGKGILADTLQVAAICHTL